MAINARLDELKKKFDENPRRYFAPLANEYRKQGNTTQAIALCRTHLPNQPGHISGHIVLAQALYESRELIESRQIFEAALDLDPENIIALRYLGDIAREQGSPAAAQALYRRVLEFDPRNEEISQLLADVAPDAEVELADLAARPTPPIGNEPALEAAAPQMQEPTPVVPAAPQEVPSSPAPLASLEIELTEPPPAPAVASAEPTVMDAVLLDGPAEALTEEPLDLYDADPTGDSWRESIAEQAGNAGPTGQAANLASAGFSDAREIPATPEPPFDDWFAQTAPHEAAAPHEPALEEFAPDINAAAPTMQPGAAADAIEQFSWSPTEAERSSESNTREPEASAEASPPEAELEFTPWDAPSARTAEPSASANTHDAQREDAWNAQPLPAIDSGDADVVHHAEAPDESAPASWIEPAAAENAHAPDVVAAFSDDMIVEEFIELPEEASPEPVLESPYWGAGPTDDAPRGESADTDTADPLPGIASLGASVEDDDESFADDLEESDADDAMAASMTSSDPLIGRTPSFVPSVSEESSAAFVTETMAELYLQQGFYDEALSIYRQLLARNPKDETLAERVRALEHGSASSVLSDESVVAHPSPDSESARAFFARFANRNPSRGGREGNALDRRGEAAHAATVPLGGAAMPDEALTRPDEPTLTNIFSDRQVPSGDAQAAKTLASAFGVSPDSMPARSGELSLQQLFRDVPARSSGAVTLGEQGTDSSQGSAGSAGAPDPHAEAPADYEQFTAWLEGLKKK